MNDDTNTNMPDPIDFKPGQKTQTNSTPQVDAPTSERRLLPYALPLIITIVLIAASQLWITASCATLAPEVRGECGAAWLNFAFIPIGFIGFIVSLGILITGLSKTRNS